MLRHMILLTPVLVALGTTFVHGIPTALLQRIRTWNRSGAPGLLLASGILATWMVPFALNRATEFIAVDTFKTVSLFLAGVALAVSLPVAQLVTQLFFVWNWVVMTAFIDVLFQVLPQRLCSTYLLDDQAQTGFLLTILAAVVGCGWCFYAWRQNQRDLAHHVALEN